MTGWGGPVWRSAARAAAAVLIAALLALCGAEPLVARAAATGPAQSAAAVVEAERFTDESATCADGQRRAACPGRAGRRVEPRPGRRRVRASVPQRAGAARRPDRAAIAAARARCVVLRC